ncbi:MAG TPA: hypothetical protein VG099_03715 [Gemmataceae bacterium]|nr:hypothetical protein [Gemmataceae bacterium]
MCKILFTLGVLLGLVGPTVAQKPELINLRVLYAGPSTTPRGRAFAKFLQKHFAKALAVERSKFDPPQAASFDVVLLDWSQNERPEKPIPPLGPKQDWVKPTVLLGSAGLLLAQAWEIHGTIG